MQDKQNELMTISNLDLEIKEFNLGVLVSNALEIKDFVENRLQDYDPANYIDRVDFAKNDKAELNRISKSMNAKRLELEREFNKPFEEFKTIVKQTTTMIDQASARLSEIIAVEEEREKEAKKLEVLAAWESFNFAVVDFQKIFDSKWLNKTKKITEIKGEMKEIIDSINRNLATIKSLPNCEIIEGLYLSSLDLPDSINRANEIVEAQKRAEAQRIAIEEQKKQDTVFIKLEALHQEKKEQEAKESIAESIGLKPDPIETYALKLTAERSKLFKIREIMVQLGIEFEKLS